MLEIHPSARNHGIADEDIEHAVTHAMAIDDTNDDARLYIGPARNAALLEVVTIPAVEGSELAIHAMACGRSAAAYSRSSDGIEEEDVRHDAQRADGRRRPG